MSGERPSLTTGESWKSPGAGMEREGSYVKGKKLSEMIKERALMQLLK